MAIGDPDAPEDHEAGQVGGDLGERTEGRDIGDRIRSHEGVLNRDGRTRGAHRRQDDEEDIVEPNIGNVSGLGGRSQTRSALNARRRSAGASIINLLPGLADTTRGSLFGL